MLAKLRDMSYVRLALTLESAVNRRRNTKVAWRKARPYMRETFLVSAVESRRAKRLDYDITYTTMRKLTHPLNIRKAEQNAC